jgi:4-amino-4-deoxy-L-arabinose transferase-like glycosyltransferase
MPRVLHGRCAFIFSLAAVVIAALFLHFWRIGSTPPGFYVDECSIAYNAYSIAQTGADEYGTRYPLFFRSLGRQDPVTVYCLVPLVKLFGIQKWVARLPSAFFYVLACIAFGFLVHEYCRNKWLSLFGGFLFSLIPWGFGFSRTIGAGYSAMLFGMVLGWLFSLRAVTKQSYGFAVGAGVAFAFAMYAYSTGLLMSVLLLVCFGFAFNRLLLSQWKTTVVLLAAYIAAMLPMVVSAVRTPQLFAARFQQVSLFHDHPSFAKVLSEITTRYLGYFDPRFLFFTGDRNLRHHTGFGGELFLFTIPLILAGVYRVIRLFRTEPRYRFLALGLLVYPAAAIFTIDRMHSGRTVNGVIPWLLLAMAGAWWLWQMKRFWRTLLLLMVCAGSVEVSLYLCDYFGAYQIRSRAVFFTELTEAMQYCFEHLGDNEVLYISPSTYSPHGFIVNRQLKPHLYAYPLFFGKIDPRQYQASGFPTDSVRLYDGSTPKTGLLLRCNYYFLSWPEDGSQPVVARNMEPLPANAVLLSVFPCQRSIHAYEVFRVLQPPAGAINGG